MTDIEDIPVGDALQTSIVGHSQAASLLFLQLYHCRIECFLQIVLPGLLGQVPQGLYTIAIWRKFIVRGQKDDDRIRQGFPNLFCQLHSIHFRHFNVQEKKIKTDCLQRIQQVVRRREVRAGRGDLMVRKPLGCGLVEALKKLKIVIAEGSADHRELLS